MKRLFVFSYLLGAMSLTSVAQDDDLYFVPKKSSVEVKTDRYGLPKDTYYVGSDRSVDEYNRRGKSTYEVIDGDSTKVDVIDFSSEKGVYPDSLVQEDYKLSKKMTRFEDYNAGEKAAYWSGYKDGRTDLRWHSPWYYSYYGWYDPWYFRPWYDPWYDPWFYGYAGWDPWYYRWGYPYRYWGYSWGYPYVHGGYIVSRPVRYRSARQPFGTGSRRSGTGSSRYGGRNSFGASYGRDRYSSSTPVSRGSFGASRSGGSSYGGGSFSGGSRSGGGSFGGSGGGRSGGGGGGFGRHR